MNRCHLAALAALVTASSSWLPAASASEGSSFSPPPGVEVREEGPRKLKYYKIPNIPMAAR